MTTDVISRPKIVRGYDPFNPEGLRAVTAASFPVTPPREWFDNPNLTQETPLTVVTATGQIFGHLAGWNTRHIGLPGNVPPPRSHSDYAYFHTGVVACADGADVPVGQLTVAGGHAPLSADASRAVEHYDQTGSAVADIHVGEDRFGIWAAGALRPSATEEQIRILRASAPSGDWRPINGRLEMVACCQVNVPGFPIVRARVASGGQEVTALVAAGASDMMMLRYRNADSSMSQRIAELETVVASLVADGMKQSLRTRVKKPGQPKPKSPTPPHGTMVTHQDEGGHHPELANPFGHHSEPATSGAPHDLSDSDVGLGPKKKKNPFS